MLIKEYVVQEFDPRTGRVERQDQMICLLDVSRVRAGAHAGVVEVRLGGEWIVVEADKAAFRAAWERARAGLPDSDRGPAH